ncbi:hypothetical protein CLRAG_11060 [Clostridium ragsdalei P11]|uniref:Uncharacterized protein n=1 Tax=Clostridium ragsdalei P11 TaxID=1353534 RepID=A0A1A6AXK8_9CLOT|nr:hypothetical protein CLRAG_11060 [Clostridium ragsdalei P11]
MLINRLLSALALRRRYPLGKIVIQGRSCSLLLGEVGVLEQVVIGGTQFIKLYLKSRKLILNLICYDRTLKVVTVKGYVFV